MLPRGRRERDSVGWLLVTNDDGVESPALLPLVRALRELAPVRTVVPDAERSWIGKAISRWDQLRVERRVCEGIEVHAVGGFPADCTNLGIHSLFDDRPELVVSGVNIGLNVGLGFFLSSGTVGAAMEGWIAGVPSIAFSMGVPDNDREWKEKAQTDSELWKNAAELCAALVRELRAVGYPEGVDLLSVNFPLGATVDTPRALTELAAVGYDGLFRRRADGQFVHDFSGALRNESAASPQSDVSAVRAGKVSITPVRLAHTAELSSELRARLAGAS
jgi:5'-nucleotidase